MYVAVLVRPSAVPFIVIVYVPAGVEVDVVMVSVLVKVGLPVVGFKVAEVPLGSPLIERLTC